MTQKKHIPRVETIETTTTNDRLKTARKIETSSIDSETADLFESTVANLIGEGKMLLDAEIEEKTINIGSDEAPLMATFAKGSKTIGETDLSFSATICSAFNDPSSKLVITESDQQVVLGFGDDAMIGRIYSTAELLRPDDTGEMQPAWRIILDGPYSTGSFVTFDRNVEAPSSYDNTDAKSELEEAVLAIDSARQNLVTTQQ